ncbi:MAG: COX15/CtaA family protein [Anaerolineae bacterium]|nr:COX15/CtaA family protein [Anaerolineae bacterium]
MQQSIPRSHLFTRLAVATALLTLGLIVFGAVVRVTDSGLGCGNHWPLCNGTIIPPLDNLTAWIEWLHRLFAVLIGLLGIGTLVVAIRAYRKSDRVVLGVTVIAAVLFMVQSGLGALVVVLDLPPTMVTFHLGTAMLLLGSLLVAAVFSAYKPNEQRKSDSVTMLTYITAALSLVIILTGALVRGSGATLACIDWPLCNGDIFPFSQGQLAIVHMTHRLAVLAFGISLLVLVWFVLRDRKDQQTRILTFGALVAYLAQAAVGALFVLSGAAPIWGAAHVGLAAATWATLVILSAIEWLNSRIVTSIETTWNPQSKTLT